MRPVKIVQRSWFYFRMGHGLYLSFVLSFVSFVVVVYQLSLRELELFAGLHLWAFSLIFVIVYGLASILVGRLHMNSQVFTDAEVTATQSPYIYKMLPVGKEAKLSTPMSLLEVRTRRAILQALGILTPEFASELDKYEQMLLTLLQGGEVR